MNKAVGHRAGTSEALVESLDPIPQRDVESAPPPASMVIKRDPDDDLGRSRKVVTAHSQVAVLGGLTSDGVARLLYGNYRESIDHARCNDIPKAALVPRHAKTQYSCEVVFKGKTPGGLAQPVRVTDAEPRVC
ncbi:hypothetical protein ACFRCW_46215 [Streptomyces sp. NPDC056653]|uniref:hypothetical protein n=1 Tax=Streptomyces sp. NPDC056653 TaxID=3345894 RepID=UPI00368F869A